MYIYPSSGPVRSRISYWKRYPYRPRFGLGLSFGWFGAAVLSLRVAALAFITHSSHVTRYQLSVVRLLLGYWIAGTVLGLVVAFAHPLIRTRAGSFCLGFVVGWLVYAIIGIATTGWDSSFLLVCLFPATLVGGGLGVVFYDDEHPAMLSPRTRAI